MHDLLYATRCKKIQILTSQRHVSIRQAFRRNIMFVIGALKLDVLPGIRSRDREVVLAVDYPWIHRCSIT